MRPDFKIVGLSAAANDRVLSIELNDNAGTEGDNVTITLDDRDYELAFPPKGLEIVLFLGYKETGLVDMGIFEIDEVQHKESQESQIVVKANAQYHTNSNIKVPKTEPWDETTLGAIISGIAKRNGYTPVVDGAVAGFRYDHLDQDDESDIHLATRLAEKHDCYVKLQDRKLYFQHRETVLGLVTVEKNTRTQWTHLGFRTIGTSIDATWNARQEFTGVKCKWRDKESNETRFEIAGGGDKITEVRREFERKEVAKMHAEKELKRLNRAEATVNSLQLPGDPKIRAEMELKLVGFRPEICACRWLIKNATHSFDDGGYRTSVRADILR